MEHLARTGWPVRELAADVMKLKTGTADVID
jgi:hypothetical protein